MYDLIILGAGPAGLTSGIYASRCNLKTLIIGEEIGGLVNEAHVIENYLGFSSISGFELMKKFIEQVKKNNVEIKQEQIKAIKKSEKKFEIITEKQKYLAKAIIIALGTRKRKLNIGNEEKFLGKGVSYCYTYDGNFFKNKTTVVIGGSDSAAKAALFLSEICKKVFVVYRKKELRCEPLLLSKLKKKKNLEIIYNSIPLEIKGENFVESLEIKKVKWKNGKFEGTGDKKEIKCDGIFVEIGIVPSTALVKNLNIELEKGFIKVNEKMETSQKGIFASGDITSGNLKQIVIASAQGAIAALSAYNYLKNLKNV